MFGAGAHTDWGMLTLLLTTGPGLQVGGVVFGTSAKLGCIVQGNVPQGSVHAPMLWVAAGCGAGAHRLVRASCGLVASASTSSSGSACPTPRPQICPDMEIGAWVDVPVLEGAFIVNLGDMLER